LLPQTDLICKFFFLVEGTAELKACRDQ